MKALIICAGDDKNPKKLKEYAKNADFVICADGGYYTAENAGIIPDITVGDFDSSDIRKNKTEKIILPVEKDETDTLYALKYLIEKGADEIIIYGAFGGLMDHSYANICLLFLCLENNIKAFATDGEAVCYMTNKKIKLSGKCGSRVSVFSFSVISHGV